MLDTLAYIIGYTVIYGVAAFIAMGVMSIFYLSTTATLDVLSQYYMLWREKRKPKEGVTFWDAWTSSFDMQEGIWGRILYRIKRAHGYKGPRPDGHEWRPGS